MTPAFAERSVRAVESGSQRLTSSLRGQLRAMWTRASSRKRLRNFASRWTGVAIAAPAESSRRPTARDGMGTASVGGCQAESKPAASKQVANMLVVNMLVVNMQAVSRPVGSSLVEHERAGNALADCKQAGMRSVNRRKIVRHHRSRRWLRRIRHDFHHQHCGLVRHTQSLVRLGRC